MNRSAPISPVPNRLPAEAGFTLTELIMAMVVVAILAVAATPYFFGDNLFRVRGFADQMQATLRYAQKVAIAQRRYVCATFTASQISLTIGVTSACGTSLNLPADTVNYIDAPSGVTISPVPANFYFNSLGKPSTGTSGGIGTITLTVETETGYVHQ